jgi:hypothetical protein
LASSIICFISASLGAPEDVVVVAALEELVVVVAGLVVLVVVVFFAGLEAVVVGAFGAAEGVWATAREAIANRAVTDKYMGLMVWGLC